MKKKKFLVYRGGRGVEICYVAWIIREEGMTRIIKFSSHQFFFPINVLLSRISIYLSPLQRKMARVRFYTRKKSNMTKQRASLVISLTPSPISFSDKERISVVESPTFLIPRSDHAETRRSLGREHAIRRPPRALLLCGG